MLKRTPLYEEHKKLNARFTEFGGWDMPVQYTSIMEEHNAVRNSAGIFDTSHMGTFLITGPGTGRFLDRVTAGKMSVLEPLKAKYSFLLNEKGGIIDDIIVYRRAADVVMVVNAGNLEKDLAWLKKNLISGVTIENKSPSVSLLALQGPDSVKIMKALVNNSTTDMKYYSCAEPEWKGFKAGFSMIARTGYTGEDGFELFVPNDRAAEIWNKVLELGARPCGLGCRDSLRLEACMPLHGHEISEEITPVEAGLSWAISWDSDFIGRQPLLDQKNSGVKRFLTAISMTGGIPRAGYDVSYNGKKIGAVVSGTYSPTLKKGIALAYLDERLGEGAEVTVTVHGQPKPAVTVKKPFYKRTGKA